MRVGRTLSDAKLGVLNAIYRLGYGTVVQIAYWSDASRHQSRTYALLSSLVNDEFVIRHDALQPHIFSLTRGAFRVIGKKPPHGSRQESWSVLTHHCHANESEIRLREHFADFEFLPKTILYKMGLNPAIAEHCGQANGQLIYVLVDDYYMLSSRLGRVKTRSHRPKKGHFDLSKTIPTWQMVCSKFVCVATNDIQYQSHKNHLKTNKLDFSMMKIEALW